MAMIVSGLALTACGSTKTVTQTRTVTTTATATTTVMEAPAPTTTTTAAPTTGSGKAPALNGSYGLEKTSSTFDVALPDNPHDGLRNADTKWTILTGSCTAHRCQVKLRRLLSDSTIEDLTLTSASPTGAYKGTIPGGDGDAQCSANTVARIVLSMIVRVGGLQNVGGQQIASRVEGHIFADYQCPGSGPSHDVATYVGTRS